MMDQDEFAGRIFEILDKIEKEYLFLQINEALLLQLKNEFVVLFQEVGHPERVDIKVSINPDDRSGIEINFFHGGIRLREIDHMYNALIYYNPFGLGVKL